MKLSEEQRHIRAQIANASRFGPEEKIPALRAEFKTSKLADHITDVANSFPPLTREQRDRLVTILKGDS